MEPIRPHPNQKHLDSVRKWAREALGEYRSHYVIIDTETTGLDGEIVQIAAIDLTGRTILDSLVRPRGEIDPEATAVHGLNRFDLMQAPSWPAIRHAVFEILHDHIALIFNAQFDLKRMVASDEAWPLQAGRQQWLRAEHRCMMLMYAKWLGHVSPKGDYRWPKLSGGDHSALGDCRATLELIHRMAGDE